MDPGMLMIGTAVWGMFLLELANFILLVIGGLYGGDDNDKKM